MKHTQKKSMIQKWAPVLESDIGKPIRSSADASVVAAMLENQVKLNKGFLPESANVTGDVEVYQQYALPLIRRQFPELLAMNTVAVIPTTTPQGIYFALRYLYDGTAKNNTFRNGQKMEVGFDLDKNHAGDQTLDGSPWTTGEGELLSNYMENGSALNTFDVNGSVGGYRIKTASIKVIKGSVIVGTRAIKSHYTLELQQDLAAVHGQDIEALLLEALQFEIQQEIDREILAALVYAAQTVGLGGEAVITIDLRQTPTGDVDARWMAEVIAGGIVNTIIAVSQKIAVTSRMGSGNWAICSPDVVASLSTMNNGIYTPTYLNTNVNQAHGGGVAEAGSLIGGSIKVYRDIYAEESYALVGYKGPRQGESGIIFMPYIPYIFTKTAGQEDGSPRLIVKSRYAIVANLLGAGQFYRYIQFTNISRAILGINSGSDVYPWETQGATYDADESLGGVGPGEGDTSV